VTCGTERVGGGAVVAGDGGVQQFLAQPNTRTSMQYPVIVIPGITASQLRDEYPVNPETVWSVLNKQYERIALHPDDDRFEVIEPARVAADQVYSIAYAELVAELRHNLTRQADEPVPVYPFAYDWRQPLEVTERRLEAFIDEVIARTKLLRHYHRDGFADAPAVDLVGHSMGGLIIAGYLSRMGVASRVRKVATLGTPYGGSFEAVLKVATGTSDLSDGDSHSRDREAARMTPALYHLLPRFDGAIIAAPGLSDNLFDAHAWQPSITATIAEYVRLHGLNPGSSDIARHDDALKIFQRMLDQAHAHRERVDSFALESARMHANDWLCIVGLGEETRVRLRIDMLDNAPCFDLRSSDRLQGYPRGRKRPLALPEDTGDGTVPYRGARPPFIPRESLVCVTSGDFGYWELRDRGLGHIAGLHSMMARMNVAHRLVVAFFRAGKGQPAKGNRSIWGRAAPDVAAERWRPPFEGLRRK
jgi:pimeloyl-ACP methyl ester carboxylesterase